MLPWILLTLVATALLLVAEARGSVAGRWVWKPLASTGFIAAALAAGAWQTTYGRLVLLALVLSWWGDVLLIPRTRAAFTAGLASFLAGHVAFAAAFLVRGVSPGFLIATVLVLALPVLLVDRWLGPHVPRSLRLPVRAYVIVISLMVASAFGTWGHAGCGSIPVGALMFFFSDLAVARDRFLGHNFLNRLWGLPLYYGGQLVLASTVAC
ncbi:MAG TPA: lysoplasmalogenase [Candidatus Binatia bacterium]